MEAIGASISSNIDCLPGARRLESDDELFRRYAGGDLVARGIIAERYMGLARRLAARYRNSAESSDDLEQVAYLGLLKTIDRYDLGAGSFTAYAIPSIRGELKRHFRDRGWGVRMPRQLQERWLRVSQATAALTSALGRSPTPHDVAERTGFTLEEVLEAMEAGDAYSPSALDAPMPSKDGSPHTLADTLGSYDLGYANVDLGASIGPAFENLPDREQQILRLRFIEDLTQTQIAERFGISQMHVCRLLRRSLEQLSNAVEEV